MMSVIGGACGSPPQTYTETRDSTTWTTVEPSFQLDSAEIPPDGLPPVEPPPAQREQPPEVGNCNPNYDPCVPNDSDVDCAGGRGNGPSYVAGPVRVIGHDVYKLDRDGDGIGCEKSRRRR